jgi:hypothetical protein
VAALGYTMQRPSGDRYLMTQAELEAQMQVLLAGTLAEQITFSDISTGAQNDLERASAIARSMVLEFGMSRLGRVAYKASGASPFLGGSSELPSARNYSEQTAREIDLEVKRLIDQCVLQTEAILTQRRAALEAITERLIEVESIDADVARALAQRHDHLTIAGPMSISGEIAAALGSYRGQVLVLDSLEEISPTVAASLAGIPGWLNLNGIRRWKAGALEAIAGHEGGMCLRVPDMTVEQAALLGKHHGFLYLTGITHLDVARARELVKHELGLDLTEARGITPQAAALLRSRPKTIRFIDTD